VECTKKIGDIEVSVRILDAGSHFGELALINNDVRTLSVNSYTSTVKLLALNRASFNRILGTIDQYLKKDYGKDNKVNVEYEVKKTKVNYEKIVSEK